MATKKLVKKPQKKVVKKKIALKKSPKRIENIDLIKYFKTGIKERSGDYMYIENNSLVVYTDYPKSGDTVIAAIKFGKYTVINGDDPNDRIGEFRDVVEELQRHGDNEITTSFECLKNAGINLQKMKVLDITRDLNVSIMNGQKGFDDFESKVPQGATLTLFHKYKNNNDNSLLIEKLYHRAGCMLIKEGKYSYICGMDENSYFVTRLPNNVTTVDKAFFMLKPKVVHEWEKKNKTQAIRQGEWFFLPTDLKKVKGMRRKALPLWKNVGNKHIADYYAVVDGTHYVMGAITHIDHSTKYLDNIIHEAIMNTAKGSWSIQGVD
jgi:hypothetical protein